MPIHMLLFFLYKKNRKKPLFSFPLVGNALTQKAFGGGKMIFKSCLKEENIFTSSHAHSYLGPCCITGPSLVTLSRGVFVYDITCQPRKGGSGFGFNETTNTILNFEHQSIDIRILSSS